MTDSTGDLIRIGVSACLLGEAVRFDGKSKPCAAVRELLATRAELVGICPEVEVGMPVPREPVDLFGDPARPRMIGARTGEDWTRRMDVWARERVGSLLAQGIAGAVLKARSPSCGIGDAAVHREAGGISVPGDGLFALALRRAAPRMPVARDEDLVSETEVEDFLERARSYAGGRNR